jgi:cytochrome c oxidase assembly factor CtaG
MPPLSAFLSTWTFDPWAAGLLLAAAAGFGWGLRRAGQRGTRWPLHRTAAFYLLGLGLYAVVSFGFLGAYSSSLRWAFSIRLAVLLFVVPVLMALGKPLTLARAALGDTPAGQRLARAARWPMKLFGNAIIAPLLSVLIFSMMLTPLSGVARLSPLAEGLIAVLVPLLGLLLILPITEAGTRTTTSLLMVEFVFAFIELMADAIPGILLRLNGHVLDGVAAASGPAAWFPNPLRDQQLAGDWLWFICEVADLPIIVLMFVRFSRTDKREQADVDALSDDEMDALAEAHLRQGRAGA